ncbi:unnamed protein product [Coffea canephora]|uniref:DH200=94 genomic scaffold, scaffold_290 n=1 Tax=Coffea canephora TaxID=49390 RepID=A0A068VGL0_COFCA|nr:unnamed protein product [Coffea canephora]
MFKSKLQELCHQKKWALPIYSCMKDGAEHSPQFKASVVVNGTNFDSPSISKSLKEAHNEAAKLAFLHFTSVMVDDKSTNAGPDIEQALKDGAINSSEDGKEVPFLKLNFISAQPLQSAHLQSHWCFMLAEVQQNYKRKLQKYAQTKKLDFPLYRTKRVEQSDALCFTAKVLVGEDIFESPGFYETTKDAEDAAAQAALIPLTMDAFRKSDDNMYKNLLQEFAQENGFFLPKYKTMKSGEDHKSTFFSTVEVGGEIFHGNPEKSKKLAEFSAAKIAHTALMQGK